MVSAVCGGVRVASLYAPNGRVVGSPFYEGKLRWFDRLSKWLEDTRRPDEALVLGGDYNVTPTDADGVPIPPDELPLAVAVQQQRPAQGSMSILALDGTRRRLIVAAIPLQGQWGDHLGAAAIFWEET